MVSIETAARIGKRIVLSNLSAEEGLAITLMLNGQHGIGKSRVIHQMARGLNGYCLVVEGGSLKEGEITGLPFAFNNPDGSSEVRFNRYYLINKIWQLEKFYYEKATKEGFLNGTVRLEVDTDGNKYLIEDKKRTLVESTIDRAMRGEDNQYKFGAELSSQTKLRLFEEGEIKPLILFIDELNRTDQQTMKELMNIILNKSVNGYDLPWWVSIVSAVNPCSQNSTYATNELDPAQLDRFLRLTVGADLTEWINYMLIAHKNENTDVVEAVAAAENIFVDKQDSSLKDATEMTPSPRSWDMVHHLYITAEELNNTKFFTPEERKNLDKDLRTMVAGKVGSMASTTMFSIIERKENNIKPAEIMTLKSEHLDEKVVKKFKMQPAHIKTIICMNLINYLFNTVDDISKLATSTNEKEKAKYNNYMSQLHEFVDMLDPAIQTFFVSKIINSEDKSAFAKYRKLAKAFSKSALETLLNANSIYSEVNNEDK